MKTFLLAMFVALFSFAGQAQVLNGDFENLNDTLVANWFTGDFGAGLKTNYVQSGTYALNVWNWYYYAKGFAVNGEKTATQFSQMSGSGTPATEKALRLTGYYYYDTTATYTNTDSAMVTIAYRKWDTANSIYDTLAFGIAYLLPTSGNLPVAFSVPIVDMAPGVEPDTVLIYIQSSINGSCDQTGNGNCLYLYVDNLKLETTTGVTDVMGQFRNIQMHPNPTNNTINIHAENNNTTCHLYSLAGKMIGTYTLNQGRNSIDISSQASGLYILELTENGSVIGREKLIKQ